VKADPALQRRLLDLAEIDAELARLAHRRRTLREHDQLIEAEKAVRTAKDKLVEVETAAGDLDRDIRRIERDVEGVRARTERDNQMLGGAGIGAKQATDLQHELETLARRQGVLEDEQLEIMEQREALGVDLEHSRGELEAAEQKLLEITERRDSAIADIDAAEGPAHRLREASRAAGRRGGAAVAAALSGLPAGARPHGDLGAARGPRRRRGALRGMRRDPRPDEGVGSVKLIVEADGGSRGNPGPAGYGAVVLDPDTEEVLAERAEGLGITTNNVAEYQGLIAGLRAAIELGATEVEVRMDSKLVVEQMSGRWQVKHPAMKPLALEAGRLVRELGSVRFGWIPRARNSRADTLANRAMDAQAAR
jgi:ribonuclease HI/predicted  nucleic acid-binding Zn-ribbon protein